MGNRPKAKLFCKEGHCVLSWHRAYKMVQFYVVWFLCSGVSILAAHIPIRGSLVHV
jgi:hypothetical protein